MGYKKWVHSQRVFSIVDESSGDIMLVIRHMAGQVPENGTIVDKDGLPIHENHFKVGQDRCRLNDVHLFQVYKPCKTLRFEVYKVNMKKQKLKPVKFLGERVIFLGLNQSFTLSASEFPGLRPNSIYFTDDCTPMI